MKIATEDAIKRSVEHVAFEFYHFQLYGDLIQMRIAGRGGPVMAEALFQAVGYQYLMHQRALLDFFYSDTGQDDDLLASDFCILNGFSVKLGSLPWENPPRWSRDVKVHLNKRLAHITSPRWKEPAPAMNYYHQYFPEICNLISAFRSALPSEFATKLSERMDRWIRRDRDFMAVPIQGR